MSYANIASHNAPKESMPQPDQSLLAGHFEGETQAHNDMDHKINVLPAGSDPSHPDFSSSSADYDRASRNAKADVDAAERNVKKGAENVDRNLRQGAESVDRNLREGADKVEAGAERVGEDVKNAANNAERDLKRGADKAGKEINKGLDKAEKKTKEFAKKAQHELEEVEEQLSPYWERTKEIIFRPGTYGGLMGVVNVGLLSTLGYYAYTRRNLPYWDRSQVGGAVAGTLALFGAESYVADAYAQTAEGRAENERAKRQGSKTYLKAKEYILRPGSAGGIFGLLNVGILGTLGYHAYINWNRRWDQRTVSYIAAGLVALTGAEGLIGAQVDNRRR